MTLCPAAARALAAALLSCLPLVVGAQPTTRYILLTGTGSQGGEQTVERGDDGGVTVRFRFKDNGRGPEFTERLRIGSDGLPVESVVQGESMIGAPIDEHFSRRGDEAQWRSTSERGSTTVKGSALYVPLNGSFESVSLALAALARAPQGRLALLPSGTLTQQVLDELTLTAGGSSRRVQLVAQTGLGLTPAFYWASTEPTVRLVAAIYPGWLTAIDAEWVASADLLAQRQRAAENKLLKSLAGELRLPLGGLTVLRNARVFDSETARVGAPSDIFMLRGRITAVLPAGAPRGGATHEIDAAGRIVLPGLFDMHVHADRWDGLLHLAAGVTTVRDMGNDNAKLQQMLDETARGELLSPQIVPCGFLEGDSPNAAQSGIVIKTLQQAREAIDWYALRGYPQLKIYNSFPRELLADTVAHAQARGMRVSGHVPAFMRAQEVVEMGFDELQHINQVLLNFIVTPTTDTRTPERFYLPAEKVAGLDFDGPAVQDFIALLKRRGTVVDPTLATFDFIKQRDGELSAPYAAIAANLPPDLQRSLRVGSMKIADDATAARYAASYAKMIDFVGRLHRAGVPLLAGTDAMAGFTLHSELVLYVAAGLTPAEALQVATRNGARYARTPDRGRIGVGQLADLVLVDGDPLRDIADIRRVALVITQGTVLDPSTLYRKLGVAPFVQDPPVLKALAASADRPVGGGAHRH